MFWISRIKFTLRQWYCRSRALALTAYGAAVPVRLGLSRLDLLVLFCQEKRTKAQDVTKFFWKPILHRIPFLPKHPGV